ncbi:MAG: GNAT family N-acetyltransferase, partial [Planctomycetota bacterium]
MTDSNSIRAIITDYDSHADAIRSIRDQVFLVEQQISPDDEYDDRDSKCVFAVAFLDNVAVGTGRLDVEKHGKVGRV